MNCKNISMESISLIKLHLCQLGLWRCDDSPSAKSRALTANCKIIVLFILFLSITGYYTLFTAKTDSEFTIGSFYTISSMFSIFWCLLCIWKREKIETLFVDLDAMIEKSE